MSRRPRLFNLLSFVLIDATPKLCLIFHRSTSLSVRIYTHIQNHNIIYSFPVRLLTNQSVFVIFICIIILYGSYFLHTPTTISRVYTALTHNSSTVAAHRNHYNIIWVPLYNIGRSNVTFIKALFILFFFSLLFRPVSDAYRVVVACVYICIVDDK